MIHILRHQKGFTLIEMAVVVLLLSFIMLPVFNFMVQQRDQDMKIATDEINERVLAALALYVKDNGRYPCPAKASLNYGDANFGREDCSTLIPSGGVIQGDIPIYDLGVPYRLAFDGRFNKYIYAVTQTETVSATFTGGGAITIYDDGTQSIVDNAPFAIVNLGPDGKGRLKQANGQTLASSCGTTAKDSENCDNDAIFRDMPYSAMANPAQANHFDDTIFYDLAREESGMWLARQNMMTGGMEITNRNTGNIGIGEYTSGTPAEKLEVNGGDMMVDEGDVEVGTSGKVWGQTFCYSASGC